MTPAELRSQLANYADGELDPAIRDAIAAKLADDPVGAGEVRRWQSLRQSAQRAVMNESVPAGLQDRIRNGLRNAEPASPPTTRPRVYRLGLSGLAAAAVVVFAVALWPQGSPATAGIDAKYFERQHFDGALGAHRDDLGVRHGVSWEEFQNERRSGDITRIAERATFYCAMPKSEDTGYCLQGASEYVRGDNTRVLHAYYRCLDRGGNLISLFVIDREIDVCGKDDGNADCYRTERREYHTAATDRISIVRWTEGGRTYVLCCGLASTTQLARMADEMEMINPVAPAATKPCGN